MKGTLGKGHAEKGQYRGQYRMPEVSINPLRREVTKNYLRNVRHQFIFYFTTLKSTPLTIRDTKDTEYLVYK